MVSLFLSRAIAKMYPDSEDVMNLEMPDVKLPWR
jgi:hypothetical protein